MAFDIEVKKVSLRGMVMWYPRKILLPVGSTVLAGEMSYDDHGQVVKLLVLTDVAAPLSETWEFLTFHIGEPGTAFRDVGGGWYPIPLTERNVSSGRVGLVRKWDNDRS